MPLNLHDILGLYGFNKDGKGRLVRHQDDRYPVRELLRNDWLDIYQAYQKKPVFHDSDFIVSFYGLSGTRACFYGVFNRKNILKSIDGPTPDTCPWARKWQADTDHYYELERDTRFDDLRDRLIIDWGPGTLAWVQKLANNKRVLEIMESGRSLPPFDDYLEFTLGYPQLVSLFANEGAHREWRAHLEAVGGIYLILAETTGDQYVGSASGKGGIWSRWRDYAQNGHGGNLLLRELIARDSAYPARFRFSILQVLPKTMVRRQVLNREALYKGKLGTRAKGLNI